MNEGKVIILCNQKVHSDRNIPNNKPDILIRDNEEGTCVLLIVAISVDRNVIKKEAESTVKYEDLTIEIQRMWNVKTKVIPVINNRGNWNHLRIVQKIPDPHTEKT